MTLNTFSSELMRKDNDNRKKLVQAIILDNEAQKAVALHTRQTPHPPREKRKSIYANLDVPQAMSHLVKSTNTSTDPAQPPACMNI